MSENKERELAFKLREAVLELNKAVTACLQESLRVELNVLEKDTLLGPAPVLEAKVLREI